MADLQQALAEWGATMEMPDLRLGPDGTMQLRFAQTGALLGVAQQDNDTVVHHAVPLAHGSAELVLRAMRQAAQVADPGQAVQVGLRSTTEGDWLVLGARIPQSELSAERMQQTVRFLHQWLAQLPANTA